MAELHVDDLLNSFDSRNANKVTKDTKAAKPVNNGWDDQEEDNFALGIGRTEQATKTKTTKKKTVTKGWGEIDAAPQQPTVQDFATIQDGEKKKKIFNKPNGQPKVPVNFEAEAESFPSLGEDRPKQAPKKPEPTPVAQPTSTSSSGVKKFVNAKKQATGETFAPLEPVQERAIPVIPEKTEPVVQQQKPAGFGFQRRAAEEQPKEVAAPVDSKFKFGGEGPKKFGNGGKISFKREEEKSEQERAREEKEREVEERLAREREELAKQREQKKSDSPKTKLEKTEKTEKAETVETTETIEQPVEEKRIAKFSNSKKKAEPVVEKKVEVVEEVAEMKAAGPVENVEMKGTLSNKSWGDGPLIKKSQKK